ncbi:serine/threonine-protein kinase [Streptomyces luteolus]|uniref:Serine/threonine-protein kinase n=1 Tax=Streptomyces luteolus TaxID=3043615 RepID=A0ABT6T5Y8_9ACTN|nr:serine/threonine-protein kinase [Streptomyces sp. B-S-A12]MDI3422469.1 serine/threonine-protein kinase [Streptomyces sp. B-S-A12]
MQPLDAGEPTVVGPYRLLGRLGAGGMGRVYLGRSSGGRTVAVKVVHPHFALDEEFRARFRREVDAARRVGGAWTAPVLDADPEASVPWVATGYVAGPPLNRAVGERGVLPSLPEQAVRVLGAGLAESLAAVHALGLVHRDVKPSNVLLTLDGPRLIDFGIARATDGTASLTSTGVSVGSPGYMAPEQILGKGVIGAADVFSLGAVLAYAATGGAPFAGDSSAALLYKVVHEEPELHLPEGELRALVADCLAKDPAARPVPEEIARRLAPEGAAALAVSGWLPGPLVEQVSRSAVSLLDLEAHPEPASGLVEFSSPSVGRPPAPTDAGTGPGSTSTGSVGGPASRHFDPRSAEPPPPGVPGFGPPDPTYAEDAARHATATSASSSGGPEGAGAVPPQRGRLAVTVDAGSAPGEGGRGRRMSCTVALAVTGALAAVTLGGVFMSGMLPGGDADNSAGKKPPADSSQKPGQPPGQAIPKRYLGTWEGKAEALDGALPSGTVRVVVEQARPGEEFGTASMTDELGLSTCTDVLILKKATEKEIVATGRAKVKGDARCTDNDHTVRLTPVGDDLEYTSENPAGGNPKARLSRR